MKRLLVLLGVTWSLSAAVGPSYAADDSGFLSSVKAMVANVAQRSIVRRIVIMVTARESVPGQPAQTYTLSSDVRLRNP